MNKLPFTRRRQSYNISGNRSFYNSFGEGLDVVAPGGETETNFPDGMLTAGGTWVPSFGKG